MPDFPKIEIVNESNLVVYFSDEIELKLPTQIAFVVNQLNDWKDVIIDLTPSYTSLLISFNPVLITAEALIDRVAPIIQHSDKSLSTVNTRLIEIPVYYSPESGLDLEDTAASIDASVEEVIRLHSDAEYAVFALGFMPGFAFMGIVDERLRLPRLDTPRTKVPKGSVAITEKQTAVYPEETPGGWRLLGRSPMKLFDPKNDPPQPYQIGDRIKFQPISREQYFQMGGEL